MIEDYSKAHIWIIGASSGIGKALAAELNRRGATLALSARRAEELQSLNEELGGQHNVFPVDVTDTALMEKTAKAIAASFCRIDSIIFMAAIYAPEKLAQMDMAVTRQIVDVNLNGAFNTVHTALPILNAQNGGQIALCGSVAGYRGLPGGQPYSATKAAVINLAESLRAEQAHNNIDVKVINPGFVRTPMTDKNDFKMPMMIEPEDAAKAIANGLQSKCFEIHFPKRFTFLMKLLHLLPPFLYFRLVPHS